MLCLFYQLTLTTPSASHIARWYVKQLYCCYVIKLFTNKGHSKPTLKDRHNMLQQNFQNVRSSLRERFSRILFLSNFNRLCSTRNESFQEESLSLVSATFSLTLHTLQQKMTYTLQCSSVTGLTNTQRKFSNRSNCS